MKDDTNILGDPEPPGDGSTTNSQPSDADVSAFEEPATSALGDPEPPGSTGDPEPPGGSLPGTGGTGPS